MVARTLWHMSVAGTEIAANRPQQEAAIYVRLRRRQSLAQGRRGWQFVRVRGFGKWAQSRI